MNKKIWAHGALFLLLSAECVFGAQRVEESEKVRMGRAFERVGIVAIAHPNILIEASWLSLLSEIYELSQAVTNATQNEKSQKLARIEALCGQLEKLTGGGEISLYPEFYTDLGMAVATAAYVTGYKDFLPKAAIRELDSARNILITLPWQEESLLQDPEHRILKLHERVKESKGKLESLFANHLNNPASAGEWQSRITRALERVARVFIARPDILTTHAAQLAAMYPLAALQQGRRLDVIKRIKSLEALCTELERVAGEAVRTLPENAQGYTDIGLAVLAASYIAVNRSLLPDAILIGATSSQPIEIAFGSRFPALYAELQEIPGRGIARMDPRQLRNLETLKEALLQRAGYIWERIRTSASTSTSTSTTTSASKAEKR